MATPKKDVDAWAATLAQGQSVPFLFSRGKTVGLLIISLIFVLVGLAMGFGGEFFISIIGFIAAAFFLLGVIVMIRRLFARTPALTVSPEGITMKTAKAGVVPWSQIIDVRAVKQSSNVFIELVITDEEADRQSAAGLGVATSTSEDGTEEKVLWAPNGLAVAKPELCHWLGQERAARATA